MEQIAILLVPIFAFALLKGWLDHRAEARSERVRLLEAALKNPAVDRATVESLTYQLTGARKPPEKRASRWPARVLALGWLSLFTGVGVWVLGEVVNERDAVAAGIIVSIIGFGFVTYPFALRELEARRVQQ
jgi:hypothetical protein